jgi:hypothetical protein
VGARIVVLQQDGTLLWQTQAGGMIGPSGVAFMRDGAKIVVADTGNNRIQV